MKFKKAMCLALTGVMLSAVGVGMLAGCEISNKPKEDDTVDADINKEASVFLNVGVLQKTPEKNLMQTWINAFQKKYPEVSLTITKQYSSMGDLVGFQSAGALPDICWTAGDQHAPYSDPQRVGGAYFRDLSGLEGCSEFLEGFYDEIIPTTHLSANDSGVYFVPRDYNRLVIYYNKTIFDKMGIPTPSDSWTWNEFLETCTKLQTKTNDIQCKKAIEWRNWAPVHYTMVRNFGADYVNSQGNFVFNSDAGEACYSWYEDWMDNTAVIGEGGSFGSYSPSGNAASTPAAAMMVDTYAKLSDYATRAELNNWELQVAAFPNYVQDDGSDGYVGVGCSGYGITTACTDQTKIDWAWKFLKWCMSMEGYNTVADLGVVCPALKVMRDAGEWLNFDVGGTVINYNAFVAENGFDLDVNFQSKLTNTKNQTALVDSVQKFWNDAGTASWSTLVGDLKLNFDSARVN